MERSKLDPGNPSGPKAWSKPGVWPMVLEAAAPVIAYPLVNPLMGVTTIGAWTFFWTSALGMPLRSAAYASAGAGIGELALGEGPGALP